MADLGVIIPAYNYAHRIESAIKSVLDSTLDVNLVVVDDGSTDDIKAVVQQLKNQGYKFTFISQENAGPATARNKGLSLINDKFVMFLDADDELISDAVADALKVLNDSEADIDLLITGHESATGEKKKYISPGDVVESKERNFEGYLINKKITMSSGSMLIRRSKLPDWIRFPEAIRNSEDIPFFAKLLAVMNAKKLDIATVVVHKHSDSLRHNLEYAKEVGESVVDYIFNEKEMPIWVKKYEVEYRARRCLSIFRTLYVSGRYSESLEFYKKALSLSARLSLQFSYLKKAFIAWLRS